MKEITRPDAFAAPRRRAVSLDPAALAVQVLTFLAADPERLSRFLALTGLDPASLRSAAQGREFAAAILGYLAQDESLLVAFAAEERLDPERVGAAIQAATETPTGDI